MRRKPIVFYVLSGILLAISFSMPMQVCSQMGRPFTEYFYHFDQLTILNWLLFFFGILNAYLIWQVFGISRFSIPLYLVILALNNYLVSVYHPYETTQGLVPHLFTTLVVLVFVIAVVKAKFWDYLSRPHMRWWATSPRVNRSLPVIVHSKEVKNMRAKTFDLSASGAFLCQLDDSWNVKINDEIKVHIDALRFECKAKIVRITFGKGNYPEGVGIRFEQLNEYNKGLIEYFITGRPENLMSMKGDGNDRDQS